MSNDLNASHFFLLWYLLMLDVCIFLIILYMIISMEGLDGLFMRPLSIYHTALCSWKLAGLSEVSCPSPISRTRTFNISANFCSLS